MDFFAHGLWTNVAFGQQRRIDRWWDVFFGIAPDIPFLPVALCRVVTRTALIHGAVPPEPFVALYRGTHSLLVFALAVGVVALWHGGRVWWPMLGWGFHISIDIFSHSVDYFPTQFLWPVSTVHVNGLSWADPTFMLVNYTVLAVVYGAVYGRHRRSRSVA